jgi:hypothetical protein
MKNNKKPNWREVLKQQLGIDGYNCPQLAKIPPEVSLKDWEEKCTYCNHYMKIYELNKIFILFEKSINIPQKYYHCNDCNCSVFTGYVVDWNHWILQKNELEQGEKIIKATGRFPKYEHNPPPAH